MKFQVALSLLLSIGISSNGNNSSNTVLAQTEFDDCEAAANLGGDVSGPIGFEGDFPTLGDVDTANPPGRDDAIAFLIGGSYISVKAAEVEGKMVILGDMIIEPEGANSLVQVGRGSGIVPSDGEVVLTVGGNIDFQRAQDTTIMVATPNGGDAKYGGIYSATGTGNLVVKQEAGRTIVQADIDTSPYEALLLDLSVKSAYWATLSSNGDFTSAINTSGQNQILFEAGDEECLQVFSLTVADLNSVTWGSDIVFGDTLVDKTILINVIAEDDGTAYINNIGKVFDTSGSFDDVLNSAVNFDSALKASILWNFPGADVTLGGGVGGPQFPGSLLIPDGDLNFLWPGSQGRTIVGGDLTHNLEGSEFHNYPFDPPCNLPLPPDLEPPEECLPEEECAIILENNGDSVCPAVVDSIVHMQLVQSDSSTGTVPDGSNLLYDISFTPGSETAASLVSFKVDNPFDFEVDMYVQYHKHNAVGHGYEADCYKRIDRPGCDPNVATIEAACMSEPATPFTLVTVQFVSPDSSFGIGGESPVQECCEQEDDTIGEPVVSYTFTIVCECPNPEIGRLLRRGDETKN